MKRSTTKWRGLVILASVLIVAGLVLSACGSSSEDTTTTTDQSSPKPGGTYNYPLTAEPVSIVPVNAQESEGMQVSHQVFEGLVKYEMNDKGEMKAVPNIAESWDTTDSQTWTFRLKKGVMYAAPVGTEVTAQDFVDGWNYVTDPKNQSYVSYVLAPIEGCDDGGYQVDPKKGLTGVTAIDPYTLQVKLRYPFAEFADLLGHTVASAWPVAYAKEIGAKAFAQKPVGTGPYMVESWKSNQAIELVKNPNYWNKDAAGYVDNIRMPIILESSTSWLEFQKGSIDYTDVPPGQVAAAKANPKVTSGEWSAKAWPSISVYFVGMNMTDKTLGQNLELRKAIAMSADAANVINIVKEGVGLPATGYIPPGIPGYAADQSPYVNNPEEAKTIVAGLGTVPTLSYWYNTDEGHQKVGEVLQAGWAAAGIQTKLSNFEWGTYLDKLSKGNQGSGSQVFRMGWITDYPSMDGFLYPLFQSEQSRTGSYTFYSNKQVDDLIQQARSTIDAQQRYNLYLQAEKLILTDMPAVPIYYYQDFRVTNNRIGGFVHNPMGFTDMWTIWVK